MRDSERQKVYSRRWYEANRATVAAKKDRKRKRLQEILREAKNRPCADCGQRYPHYVMDLDHVRGEKVVEVSRLPSMGTVGRLLAEIEKCDVVCSNCHRERTFQHLRDVAQG